VYQTSQKLLKRKEFKEMELWTGEFSLQYYPLLLPVVTNSNKKRNNGWSQINLAKLFSIFFLFNNFLLVSITII